jgi:hypothetical protein
MDENWLEISGGVDAQAIMRQIRARLAQRQGDTAPEAAANALWEEMLGEAARQAMSGEISIRREECDLVPHNYAIDWRIPILGPIHAVVRRVINAEIQRYLLASLRKQSQLNLQMLRAIKALQIENRQLRAELQAALGAMEPPPE